MAVQELNKVLYVDADFLTAVNQVKNFLNTNYPDEFNDYVNANLGQALIDIIGYAEQNLMWYLNRKVTDLYFPTAITPNSVSKIARMLGYKSKAATAAAVSVSVTLSSGPYSFPVTISNGFQFRGPNNTVWEYRGSTPIIYNAGETVKTFDLSQGYTVVNNFISSGQNNQVFRLLSVPSGKYIDGQTLTVTIDNEEWTEYPAIPYEVVKAYESNLVTFPPLVKFGDGVQGVVPTNGSAIVVNYVVTDGFRGRIVHDSITEPIIPLVAQFQTIPVKVSQPNPSVGGDDPEDTRSITVNAPVFQRTQDRAITKGDYDYLSNSFPNVARADAKVLRSISGDITIGIYFDAITGSVNDAIIGFDGTSGFNQMYYDLQSISGATVIFEQGVSTQSAYWMSDVGVQLTNIANGTNNTIGTFKSVVDVLFDTIKADGTDIDAQMVTLVDNVDTIIEVRRNNINLMLDDINDSVSGCSGSVIASVGALVTSIKGKLVELQGAVYGENNSIQGVVNADVVNINTQLTSADAAVTSLSGNIDSAVSGYRNQIYTDMANIDALIVSGMGVYNQSVSGYFYDMVVVFDGLAKQIDSVSGLPAEVIGYVEGLSGYLDEHISDACNANLVQVAVLGKDATRKYVDPLTSTLQDLKAYLTDRKEITQTISVITGMANVVNADVRVEVRVNKNADENVVVDKISNALTKADVEPFGLLVERQFNDSLYVWEIQNAIKAAVNDTDVDYVNIMILGPDRFLDEGGNLVIPEGFVIQAGTVNIVKLPRYTGVV